MSSAHNLRAAHSGVPKKESPNHLLVSASCNNIFKVWVRSESEMLVASQPVQEFSCCSFQSINTCSACWAWSATMLSSFAILNVRALHKLSCVTNHKTVG